MFVGSFLRNVKVIKLCWEWHFHQFRLLVSWVLKSWKSWKRAGPFLWIRTFSHFTLRWVLPTPPHHTKSRVDDRISFSRQPSIEDYVGDTGRANVVMAQFGTVEQNDQKARSGLQCSVKMHTVWCFFRSWGMLILTTICKCNASLSDRIICRQLGKFRNLFGPFKYSSAKFWSEKEFHPSASRPPMDVYVVAAYFVLHIILKQPLLFCQKSMSNCFLAWYE